MVIINQKESPMRIPLLFLFGLVFFGVSTFSHADPSILEKEIFLEELKDSSDVEIYHLITFISERVQTPILVESNVNFNTRIKFPAYKAPLKIILTKLCSLLKGHRFSLENGIIQIQDQEMVTREYYPLDKYKLSLDIKTNDCKKWVDNDFEKILEPYRLSFGNAIKCHEEISINFKDKSLRQILSPILIKTKKNLWIETSDPASRQLILQNTEKQDPELYKKIKDIDGNIYFAYWLDGYVDQEKAPEPDLFIGTKLLPVKLSVDKKEKTVRIDIRNASDKNLSFKKFRTEGLVIYNDYNTPEDNDVDTDFIYPSLAENIPEDFILKPGETQSFSFKLTGARRQTCDRGDLLAEPFPGKDSFDPDTSSRIKLGPMEMLDTLHKVNNLKPLVYFYDEKGKKYLSSEKFFKELYSE